MLWCHQFPQEGANHSLVTWMNGESRQHAYPMHQVIFVLHWTGDSRGHCSAGMHRLLRHGEQRVVTLADFVALKATWGLYSNNLLPSTLFTRTCDLLEKYMRCPLLESDWKILLLIICLYSAGVSQEIIYDSYKSSIKNRLFAHKPSKHDEHAT